MPLPDRDAGRILAARLRDLEYTPEAVEDALGDDAYSGGEPRVPVHERRLGTGELDTAIRLLFLQLDAQSADVARALDVDALVATGIVTVDAGVVRPRGRIVPVADVLLASDGFSRGAADPPDWVATYTPTARILDLLTPRPRVTRALDVGTGSGIHALLAANHADHVVATDINERALAFTALNAHLNDVDNIETRRGSLFDPVRGETFDLIMSNAPFVVSPEHRFAYRDGGLEGDELSRRVVTGATEHLAANGFASLLVSWIGASTDAADDTVVEWAAAAGCDAWVLPIWWSDALEHAASWNGELEDDPGAYGAAIETWLRYLDGLGAAVVSEGCVILHRRPGRTAVRLDTIDEDDLTDASDQILRAFAARERLTAARDAVLDEPFALASTVRIECDHDNRGRLVDARLRLDEGTGFTVDVDEALVGVLTSLDGRTTLRELLQDDRRLRRSAAALAHDLAERGMLMPP
jgi:methylase of polypeptide subunit release factors